MQVENVLANRIAVYQTQKLIKVCLKTSDISIWGIKTLRENIEKFDTVWNEHLQYMGKLDRLKERLYLWLCLRLWVWIGEGARIRKRLKRTTK